MALIHVNFFSEVLGMGRSMDVVIPQVKNGVGQNGAFTLAGEDIPLLYLLHGGSDDQTMWQRRTSIERYAVSRGLAVVMPATDLGCYTNMKYGHDFYTFYAEELPELVNEFFPCLTRKREKTFIAGQSMGGYGALKLGLLHPERFSHVAALSALTRAQQLFEKADTAGIGENIFGSPEELKGTENDLYADADRFLERLQDGQNKAEKPRFLMICGTEDFLYQDNQDFFRRYHESLEIEGYWESGEHEWGFWDRNIVRVLDWLPLDAEGEGK